MRLLSKLFLNFLTLALIFLSSGCGSNPSPSGGSVFNENSDPLGKSLFNQIQSQHQRESQLSQIAYQKNIDITLDNAVIITPKKVEKRGPQIELTFSLHWKSGYLDNLLNFFRETSDMYWEGENLDDLLGDQYLYKRSGSYIGQYSNNCTQWLNSMSQYAAVSNKFRNPKNQCPKALYVYHINGKPKFIAEYTSTTPNLGISRLTKDWGKDYMWEIKYLDKNRKILDRQCSMLNLAMYSGGLTADKSRPSLWFVETMGNQVYLNETIINGLPAISQHRIKVDQPRNLIKAEDIEISLKYVERRKFCRDGYFLENGKYIDEN